MTSPKTLEQLIKLGKFDWVNTDITSEHFPDNKERGKVQIFQYEKKLTSEEISEKMDKDGFRPATIYELLEWEDWNGADMVVALGSVWLDPDGSRVVPFLWGDSGVRFLDLDWFDDGWGPDCRFAAVRKSHDTLNTKSSSDTLTLCPSCGVKLKIELAE